MSTPKDKNKTPEPIKQDEQQENLSPKEQAENPETLFLDKIADLEDKLLRNIAEMDNLRKRVAKELDDARKYSIASLVKDLIDTVENMHRAIESIDKAELNNDPLVKSIYDGVEMTMTSMMGAITKHGVKRINPLGEDFDHNNHQAIGQIETTEHPSGSVAQVIQAGYVLGDRLLRPALVMVAK